MKRSYWPGPFRCDQVEGLPRTNNELEPFFGAYRYHDRRCSGRKVACPGTVVRGSVRLVPWDLGAWRELRGRWSGTGRCGRWAAGSAATR